MGNRVQAIREKTSPESWCHVKAKDYPADIASRSVSPKELSDSPMWLNGPDILCHAELPENTHSAPTLDENGPKVRKVTTIHAVNVESQKGPLGWTFSIVSRRGSN